MSVLLFGCSAGACSSRRPATMLHTSRAPAASNMPLSRGCAGPADVGFGVGHTRETETKGIWVWGEPQKVNDGNGERMVSCAHTPAHMSGTPGTPAPHSNVQELRSPAAMCSWEAAMQLTTPSRSPLHAKPLLSMCPRPAAVLQLLFVDTEGFESTGRSNSYDDRVFAVATVLSSLLIYNLPETIRGSDVSKLSFVVELAAGFYDQGNKVRGVHVHVNTHIWSACGTDRCTRKGRLLGVCVAVGCLQMGVLQVRRSAGLLDPQ